MGQVVPRSELLVRRGNWKRNGVAVVCAIGHFDLLHPGHIRFLEQARTYGQILLVGVATEAGSASKVPLIPASERAEILAALAAVDFVVPIDETPDDFLQAIKPDVVVQGGAARFRSSELSQPDSSGLPPAGYKLISIPLEPGYSTAAIVQRILQSPA